MCSLLLFQPKINLGSAPDPAGKEEKSVPDPSPCCGQWQHHLEQLSGQDMRGWAGAWSEVVGRKSMIRLVSPSCGVSQQHVAYPGTGLGHRKMWVLAWTEDPSMGLVSIHGTRNLSWNWCPSMGQGSQDGIEVPTCDESPGIGQVSQHGARIPAWNQCLSTGQGFQHGTGAHP